MTKIFWSHALCACSIAVMGCVPISSTFTNQSPRAAPGASPRIDDESETLPVRGTVSLDGSWVVAHAEVPRQCRSVTVTPMIADKVEHRTFERPWGVSNWLFGISGAALIGGGVVGVTSSCPAITGTATDGNVYNNECLPKDQERQDAYKLAGAISIGAGVALAGVIIANSVRVRDRTEVVTIDPTIVPSEWRECGADPAVGKDLVLRFPNSDRLESVTDRSGNASFDLSRVAASKSLLKNLVVEVTLGTQALAQTLGKIDLASSPMVAEWEARVAEEEERNRAEAAHRAEEARKQEVQRQEAQREAERKQELELIRTTTTWKAVNPAALARGCIEFFRAADAEVVAKALEIHEALDNQQGQLDLCQSSAPNEVAYLFTKKEWRVSPRFYEAMKAAIQHNYLQCYNGCIKIIGATPYNCDARCTPKRSGF